MTRPVSEIHSTTSSAGVRVGCRDLCHELVGGLCAKYAQAEVLRRRGDGVVLRLPLDSTGSTIVKLWSRPGVRGLLRRWSQTSSAQREMRALSRLRAAGVSVPALFGYVRLPRPLESFTDALFIEDLGRTETALAHLKQHVAQGSEDLVYAFEEETLALTQAILSASIVDPDHGLHNTLVTSDGRTVRIDFEVAQCVLHPRLAPRMFGHMLGRLITSYVLAVQPEVHRLDQFISRLVERLHPPLAIRRRAAAFIDYKMKAQKRCAGIDTRVELNW